MVVSIPSWGMGTVVGAHVALGFAKGPYASLGRGEHMPRGLGALVLTWQGSSKAKIILDGVQGSGALMMS
jgi:hypothetical protein